MTQWSDDRPGGGSTPPPPPPGQYGPPPQQYQQPPGPYQQQAGQYGPPPAPYGYPGSGPGAQAPRETGALVVCLVLLLLAIIGSFIASAAVDGNLTDDSSSSPPPIGGGYDPGAGVEGGSSSSGSTGGGTAPEGGSSSTSDDPNASAAKLVRNFPLYPGARRVASSKPYLPRAAATSKYGKKYVVHHSTNTVYNWYLRHLADDHLEYYGGAASTIRDRATNKVIDAYGTISSPVSESVNGNFNIEQGRERGTCVLTVTLYG